MASKCCPTNVKPAVNNYKGVGKKETLEGLYDLYITGDPSTAKHIIFLIYDVFGFTPNAEQLADYLAAASNGDFLVCMPDVMRGQQWSPDNIPPTKAGKFPEGVEPVDGVDGLIDWILNHPTCKFDRTEELEQVKEYLKKQHNMTGKVGAVGICWGGKVCFKAAATKGVLDAIATCHGSFIDKADAEAVTVPVCMLDSKDEPETYKTDVRPILETNPFASLNFLKDFETMHHGWMGTRGIGSDTDFGDDEVRKRHAEGVSDLVNFFKAAFAE